MSPKEIDKNLINGNIGLNKDYIKRMEAKAEAKEKLFKLSKANPLLLM